MRKQEPSSNFVIYQRKDSSQPLDEGMLMSEIDCTDSSPLQRSVDVYL